MTPDHNALIGGADGARLPVRHRVLRPRLPHGAGRRRGDARPVPGARPVRRRQPASTAERFAGSDVAPSSTSSDPLHDRITRKEHAMTPAPRSLPTPRSCGSQALDAARRCGVDVDAVAGDGPARSPINGAPLARVRWQRRGRGGRRGDPRPRGVPRLAHRARAGPRRRWCKRFGELLARAQGRPRRRWSPSRSARSAPRRSARSRR